jgi:hypothetical protein
VSALAPEWPSSRTAPVMIAPAAPAATMNAAETRTQNLRVRCMAFSFPM